MKTLLNPSDQNEIVRRLQTISPTTQRIWGKMSVHQMVCHLSDGYRMFIGEKLVPPAPVSIPPVLLKWAALWIPLPWPKGFKAAPALDQHIGGTPPVRFEPDMSELLRLPERFADQPRNACRQPHPHFGPLSHKEWMRLGYRHPDHHLRQFGA
jgi:hypothetical protein